jgi:thiosulfate dehydrogenase
MRTNKTILLVCIGVMVLAVSAGVLAQKDKKMDMPDKLMKEMNMSMENMAKVMLDMKMEDRPKYMMKVQKEAVERGQKLFNNAKLGRAGRDCSSCHPGGGTTGGEAEVPMKGRFPMNPKLPIPTLVGAASSFPKYKVPNDAVITLEQMNNNCIKMFMMGDGLELVSEDARSLAAYVSTLSDGETYEAGKMQMMMK